MPVGDNEELRVGAERFRILPLVSASLVDFINVGAITLVLKL
jgi:hypothetical protein